MRHLVSLGTLALTTLGPSNDLRAQTLDSDAAIVQQEQSLLERLSIVEKVILRRLNSAGKPKDSRALDAKAAEPFIGSLHSSLLGKPFQGAFPVPSIIIRGQESPENQMAAYHLLVELTLISGDRDQIPLHPESIQSYAVTPGIDREVVFRLLVARLYRDLERGVYRGKDARSILRLLESFQDVMGVLSPVDMKGWDRTSSVMKLQSNDLKDLYAKLYGAFTRIGDVEALKTWMNVIATETSIPDFVREEVRAAVRYNVENLMVPAERPKASESSAFIESMMPKTFSVATERAPVQLTQDPMEAYKNFPRLMSGPDEWKRWNETYEVPTEMNFKVAGWLEHVLEWGKAVYGKSFEDSLAPYVQTLIRQLRADDARDPAFNKNNAVLVEGRKNLEVAESFLVEATRALGDAVPDFERAFLYSRSAKGKALKQGEVDRIFWKLIPSVYAANRYVAHPENSRIHQYNLSILSTLGLSNPAENFDSFYKIYLAGLDAEKSFDEREVYIRSTPVHPAFQLRLRQELTKTFGERMAAVDYLARNGTEAQQRSAYLKEVFDWVRLSGLPHGGESAYPQTNRKAVISNLVAALQDSGTDLSFEEIQFAKTQLLPADPDAGNERAWQTFFEGALLDSNLKIAKASKTPEGRAMVEAYTTMAKYGVGSRMLRGQIPSVKGGTDLMLQFNRTLPRTAAQISAGHKVYEPNPEQAHGYTTADAAYHMYLVQLWSARAEDLAKDATTYDSHEINLAILTLKRLITDFPNNKPEAPAIKAISDIERYAQKKFPKGFVESTQATIEQLMKIMVYSQFRNVNSADQVLENLQSVSFDEFEIGGLVEPVDYKNIQRQIMLELLPRFLEMGPTSGQIAEYAWVFSSSTSSPRPKLHENEDGSIDIAAGSPVSEFFGAMIFDPKRKDPNSEVRLKRVSETLEGKGIPFETEVDPAQLAVIRSAVLIQMAGQDGIEVESLSSEELARLKSQTNGALKVSDRNGRMFITPTLKQKVATAVSDTVSVANNMSLYGWSTIGGLPSGLGNLKLEAHQFPVKCRSFLMGLRVSLGI